MDYKYITQLLERYWECRTSLEEENILKAFFSQKDVPEELLRYKALFDYTLSEPKEEVLGDDFDEEIMSLINEPAPVKARIITLQQKLTLGNAAQVSMNDEAPQSPVSGLNATHKGRPVALGDSAAIDTMQHSSIDAVGTPATSILK